MKQRVIIKKVPISLMGELRQFQIKIPRNAARIIGIETGIIEMGLGSVYVQPGGGKGVPAPVKQEKAAPQKQAAQAQTQQSAPAYQPQPIQEGNLFFRTMTFRPAQLIGELKLQSLEEANIFYATDIYEHDLNFIFADFSITRQFIAQAWTHGRERIEDIVKVDRVTTILQGIYKDRLGERQKQDTRYSVNVYVWYEIKDEKDDNCTCP
jgi:hypothetical protein